MRELDGQIISEQADIFVMDTDPDTNDAANLTNSDGSEIYPTWSPDGTKIASLAGTTVTTSTPETG